MAVIIVGCCIIFLGNNSGNSEWAKNLIAVCLGWWVISPTQEIQNMVRIRSDERNIDNMRENERRHLETIATLTSNNNGIYTNQPVVHICDKCGTQSNQYIGRDPTALLNRPQMEQSNNRQNNERQNGDIHLHVNLVDNENNDVRIPLHEIV
jgi:hypothetical protein